MPTVKIQIPLIFMKLKSYCWYLLEVRIFIWECIPIWLLAIGKTAESHISSVNLFDKSLYFRILIILIFFSYCLTFCISKKHILLCLCSHVHDIKFASIILDLLSIINSYNEDVILLLYTELIIGWLVGWLVFMAYQPL